MILFTKPDCEKCEYVKRDLPAGAAITTLDITTRDGLAELAFHGLVSVAEKELPILLQDDGGHVAGAIRVRKALHGC
jgi:hypothetical protein